MRINRRGAGLQPRTRRPLGPSDGLADHARRLNARVQDVLSIRRVVAAVDAASRQIDDNVRAVNDRSPGAERDAIPLDDAPRTYLWLPAEDDDIMAIAVECTRQDRSDLS